ncbi:hypothetical protein ACIBL3_26645 [Kribbella sp. NPDC050124]|uniref:hypothetical protein n=1 Tax=Kribbella sp. NPDC050124 TaxID=3364114 RepID=UPI0037A2F13B
MRMKALAVSAVLLGTTVPAGTAVAAPTAACQQKVGSITAAGAAVSRSVQAGTPPTATGPGDPWQLFSPGLARASTSWTWSLTAPQGTTYSGTVIAGSALYYASYGWDRDGKPFQDVTRAAGGWGSFTAVASTYYTPYVGGPIGHNYLYGLRNDGVIFRWRAGDNGGWHPIGSFAGFSAVKTLTVISETKTYDTFLATTYGGALYTIRIPTTNSSTPVVKVVRRPTWGAFESLVAEKCGTQGTLLTAIDTDGGAAYLYAVGHANGTSTVIQGLGKLPGTFKDPVNHRLAPDSAAPLFGE